jgi:hypothetical protein
MMIRTAILLGATLPTLVVAQTDQAPGPYARIARGTGRADADASCRAHDGRAHQWRGQAVRGRTRAGAGAILDERADQALSDKVTGLVMKMTIETLNLRPNTLVNVTPREH